MYSAESHWQGGDQPAGGGLLGSGRSSTTNTLLWCDIHNDSEGGKTSTATHHTTAHNKHSTQPLYVARYTDPERPYSSVWSIVRKERQPKTLPLIHILSFFLVKMPKSGKIPSLQK